MSDNIIYSKRITISNNLCLRNALPTWYVARPSLVEDGYKCPHLNVLCGRESGHGRLIAAVHMALHT